MSLLPFSLIVLILLLTISGCRMKKSKDKAVLVQTFNPEEFTSYQTIDSIPDTPIPFGYKCAWIAVKTDSGGNLLPVLQLSNIRQANWQTGIEAAYDGFVFVAPLIRGWTLVISAFGGLPNIGKDENSSDWMTLMTKLAQLSDDVQYFGSHRVSDFAAFARFVNGTLQRKYAYGDGEVLTEYGSRTVAEIELGFKFWHYDDNEETESEATGLYESDIMILARKWSLAPIDLGSNDAPVGVGWVGIPQSGLYRVDIH